MLRKPLLLVSILILHAAAFAQQFGTVNGTITDSSGRKMDVVSIVVQEDQKYAAYSDSNGVFRLKVPANQQLTLVFSSLNIVSARKKIEVSPGQVLTIKEVVSSKEHEIDSVEIIEKRNVIVPSVSEIKAQPLNPSVSGDISDMITSQALGVHKSSELSTDYSVRGGNFDENLVYVNDFEIYRPYLVRAGEQEGLSFVNPDMVDNIQFSSGGFQAKYGDKMSSVMDVTYRKPDSIHGSFYASFLGLGGHLEGTDKKKRFTFSVGVRQKLSQYILQSLDTKGEYSPNFLDVQAFLTYTINDKLQLEGLANYSRNAFNFVPVDRTTTFGLLTQVEQLQVYYNGQEGDLYQASTDGMSLIYKPKKDLVFKFLASFVLDQETQAYDIDGQYYLSELNSNIGSSGYGQTLYSLGSGGLQNWARDYLDINVYTAGIRGSWYKNNHTLQWGFDYKHEVVHDQISEWQNLDSAGYSVPYSYTTNFSNIYNGQVSPFIRDTLQLNSVLKSTDSLSSNRIAGFVQDTWKFGMDNRFSLNYGARFEYWDVNKEPIATPRAQFTYRPKIKAHLTFTAAAGTYYQPPFYREMRNDFTGVLNTSLLSQKSFHAVAGVNYSFVAWHRNFNFAAEAFYKFLWDQVPYQYSDVQIYYLGNNSGQGTVYGVDMRLNGELAKGAESWISMSVMSAQQKMLGVEYTAYYDSAHQQVAYNADNLPIIVDSAKIKPGRFPLPTDQRVNFNMFFQDYIPQWPFLKLHINLVFGTGLPFGPPGPDFWNNILRSPPYRRVDMGFSGQLWNPKWAKRKNKFNQGLHGVWLSLEVFNVFGISNVISYLWVSDYTGDQYAVPNYGTSRRLNLKLLANF